VQVGGGEEIQDREGGKNRIKDKISNRQQRRKIGDYLRTRVYVAPLCELETNDLKRNSKMGEKLQTKAAGRVEIELNK